MKSVEPRLRRGKRVITGIGIAALAVYLFSSFLPESPLWGFNHLAFLTPFQRICFIVAIGLVLLPAVNGKISSLIAGLINRLEQKSRKRVIVLLLLLLCAGLCFYLLSIETDMYGDTRSIVMHEPDFSIMNIFKTTAPEPISRLLPQGISSMLGITPVASYRLISYGSGILFLLMLLNFVKSIDRSVLAKTTILLVGLSGGFLVLFFGHIEHYTLLFVAVTLFLMLGWKLFSGRNVLGWMIGVFLVGTRVHIEMVLLLPGLIYAVFHWLGVKKVIPGRWTRLNIVSSAVGLSVVAAILLYVFYFRAYALAPDNLGYRIFLPVVNTVPLMNNYTLQSWAHLSDFMQVLGFLISPAIIFLFVIPFFTGDTVRFDNPRTVFYSINAVYCLMFGFTLYPFLSIPRDWDMYAVVAAPVLFTGISFMIDNENNKQSEVLRRAAIPWMIVLAMLSNSIILVNGIAQAARKRVRSVGVWVFRSYHGDSSFLINVGCKRIPDLNVEIAERERIIAELAPYAKPNDMEFSFLEQKLAEAYYSNGQLTESINHYGLSLKAADNSEALKGLGIVLLKAGSVDDGIQVIDTYNHNYNEPEITDHHMLIAAQYGQYLKYLIESGADESEIRSVLNSFEVVPSQAENPN